jgi:hypothetical protein
MRSAAAWALRGAVRLAIGSCVVALLLAGVMGGDAGERFATTAYLAVIFAAVALALERLFPQPREPIARPAELSFPVALFFTLALVVFVGIVAALVARPGAEAQIFIVCFALVLVAALARSGAIAAMNAALLRGGAVAAVMRYAVAFGIAAIALVPLVSADAAEAAARTGYRAFLFATLLFAWLLFAPTALGVRLRSRFANELTQLDALGQTLLFQRITTWAAIVAAGALVVASLLRNAFAEPLAVTAYVAAAAAAFGVVMECRRLRA